MKRLSSQGGELILCLVFYFDADMPLLIWSVLHVCGLVQIPKHCMKMLHKTVCKTVGLLWRYVLVCLLFTLMLTSFSVPKYCLFCMFLGSFGYLKTP